MNKLTQLKAVIAENLNYLYAKRLNEQQGGIEIKWQSCNGNTSATQFYCVDTQYGVVGEQFHLDNVNRNVYVTQVGGSCPTVGVIANSGGSTFNLTPYTGPCNNNTGGPSTTGSLVPCYGCDNGQIINSQTQWGLTFTPNSNPQSPNFGWCANHNGIDLYDSQNHTALSGCTGSLGCQQSEFQYTSSTCGAQHLQPAPGGPNSWNGWLNSRWTGYQNAGCQHLQSVVNWNTQQLTPTTACPAIWQGFGGGNTNTGVCWNLIQVKRKQAQIAWAGCMQTDQCGC
jgi:hypothetical protein